MKNIAALFLIGSLIVGMSGCSSGVDENAEPEEHVWQDQVDALEEAKQVESMVMDSAAQQRKALEEAERGEGQ